jgi:hypothetical protein
MDSVTAFAEEVPLVEGAIARPPSADDGAENLIATFSFDLPDASVGPAFEFYERWWPTAGWRRIDGQHGAQAWSIHLYKDKEDVSLSVWASGVPLALQPTPLLCIVLAAGSAPQTHV